MRDDLNPEIHDCSGDAAAYVLGALEPAEVEPFLRHLEQCSVCRDEVDSLQGVVQALPMAAPQYPAPARLRRRIMRDIRQEQAQRRRVRMPAWTTRWSPGQWVGGLAVACTAVLVVVALQSSTARPSVRAIRAQVTAATGSAQLEVSGTEAVLIVHHLARPGHGRVYEVWLKAPHSPPVPANVLFGVSSQGNAEVAVPRSLHGMSLMMVTNERAGGSPVPTGKPVIVAKLT
jgi:anti-sigma-K factor RskA